MSPRGPSRPTLRNVSGDGDRCAPCLGRQAECLVGRKTGRGFVDAESQPVGGTPDQELLEVLHPAEAIKRGAIKPSA